MEGYLQTILFSFSSPSFQSVFKSENTFSELIENYNRALGTEMTIKTTSAPAPHLNPRFLFRPFKKDYANWL